MEINLHYDDVIMGGNSASNHQPNDCLLNRLFGRRSKYISKPASLAFVWRIHRGPVNSPHKGPVTRKMFPFDDIIMREVHSDIPCICIFVAVAFYAKHIHKTHKYLCSAWLLIYRNKLGVGRNITDDTADDDWGTLRMILLGTWMVLHDDVIKWKHFPRYCPFVRGIHRSNSPHKGQWRTALMFTLICTRINGWVNSR